MDEYFSNIIDELLGLKKDVFITSDKLDFACKPINLYKRPRTKEKLPLYSIHGQLVGYAEI